jgi:integrase
MSYHQWAYDWARTGHVSPAVSTPDPSEVDPHMATPKRRKLPAGIRVLDSGRYQARYTVNGRRYNSHRADGSPLTFDTVTAASTWLVVKRSEIARKEWEPPTAAPKAAPKTLREFGDAWLDTRHRAVRTREHYEQLLRDHVYPTFGGTLVHAIRPADVRKWHADLGKRTGPTAQAHSYALLKSICKTAVDDELLTSNPCRVTGGGQAETVVDPVPATLPELAVIVETVPARYRLMVLLAAWCALRFGELAELRRSDVDVAEGVLHVRRGVVRTNAGRLVKAPKSKAGKRTVAIPAALMPVVQAHLLEHTAPGADGLLWPGVLNGAQLAPSTLYRVFYPAREAAGRPDLRFHDLRHTGATLAAATGATLKQLMARLGHSSAGAALRYQHAALADDKRIAGDLSKMITGSVTPIADAPSAKKQKPRRRSA